MNNKLKKIMGICLVMVFAFSLALPVYAAKPDYEFDEQTGHLTIGKVIEDESIKDIGSIPPNKIKSVTIKDGVTKICENAFEFCEGLISVTIPNSVESIDMFAFSGCINLTSINIPNGVTEIGAFAFSDCSSLTSITIPNSETKIYQSVFDGCTDLETVTVGNKVYNMGE